MPATNNYSTIFYNSDYIVIEYIDMIKSPYLLLLALLRNNMKIREILKIEDIEFLDEAGLYEWYINRKHQNFFLDLNRYPEEITKEQLDKLLDEQISITPIFYQKATPLILTDMLKVVERRRIVKQVIIYHPHPNTFAKEDLESMTGGTYLVLDDFNEVMEKAGYNSTYFLSDIDKMLLMKEKGVLKCASVTLPIEYRYNKKNMKDMKLDLDELMKTNPYKLSFCNACSFIKNPEDFNDTQDDFIGGQ